MLKAVSDILESLEQAKKAKSMQELLPFMLLLEPLENGLHDFFEEKLKPIHERLEKGEDPFPEESKEESKPKGFDWNEYLKGLNSGEPS